MSVENDNDVTEKYTFGLITTPNGLAFSPAPTFEGKVFKEIIYDKSVSPARYVTSVDGVTMEILFSEGLKLEHITNDYLDIWESVLKFRFETKNLKDTPIISESFKNEVFPTEELPFKMEQLVLEFFSESTAVLYIEYIMGNNPPESLRMLIDYELRDNKLYFNNLKRVFSHSLTISEQEKPYYSRVLHSLHFIYKNGEKGYHIKKRGEKYVFSDPVYVLQNGDFYFPAYGITYEE